MGICMGRSGATLSLLKPINDAKYIETSLTFLKLTELYTMTRVIGQGAFGLVRLGSLKDNPKIQVAIKTISKAKLKNDMSRLINEVEVLLTIDHPNIVKLYNYFDEDDYFHIVTEYCSGGELFERIINDGRLQETVVMNIMKKMMRAVNHLHKLGICHRDLKPQNFIFENKEPGAELKLIDFGLAHRVHGRDKQPIDLASFVGSPFYVAPEVIKGLYDYKCDVWSLGIIMVVMLTGAFPFTGTTTVEIFECILNENLDVNSHVFKHISKSGIDLILKMLVKDPNKRISIEDALKHPWFKYLRSESANLEVFRALHSFKSPNDMCRVATSILIKFMSPENTSELRTAFNELDSAHTGYLNVNEIETALSKCGISLPKEELNAFFTRLDYDGNGIIYYSEFLAAVLSNKLCVDDRMMLSLFNHFDLDRKGAISLANLRKVLLRMGLNYSDDKIACMIQEVNSANTGSISFEEFKEMLNKSVE